MAGTKRGRAKARVHTQFKARLASLQDAARAQADSLQQTGQRPWQIPAGMVAGDVFDIAGMHAGVFDRRELNDNYVDCVKSSKDPGTIGDVISLRLQLGYVAAEERAFRARHASVVRNLTHAMSRRHGMAIGAAVTAAESQAAAAIAAGAGQ